MSMAPLYDLVMTPPGKNISPSEIESRPAMGGPARPLNLAYRYLPPVRVLWIGSNV